MAAETTLTPEQVKDFQNRLKQSIEIADKAIYDSAQKLPSLLDAMSSLTEDILTAGYLVETKKNVRRTYDDAIENWELWKKSLWSVVGTGTVEGRPLTVKTAEGLIQMPAKAIKNAQGAVALVNQYAKGDILIGAVGKVFGDIAEILKVGLDAVMAVAKGALSVVGTVGKALNWLPWVIGGVIVLPLLLRTFSAYKRGGATAAAEEAAGQIERGRAAAGRAVAAGARKLATRGMAGMRRSRGIRRV